jgi:RNA polymerase sigma factor (sigma-70 family)
LVAPRQGLTAVVPGESLTDAGVIDQSHHRPDIFAVLYDRYAAALYRYAARRLGPQAAEDAVADTFLSAFAHRHTYDARRPDARPWLFGILTHAIARHFRTEQARYRALTRVASEPTVDDSADRVAATVTASASRGRLAAALGELPPDDRDVLLLYAWAELSYEQIAQTLDIPVGTVRSRLHRVRRTLRRRFDGRDPMSLEENDHV